MDESSIEEPKAKDYDKGQVKLSNKIDESSIEEPKAKGKKLGTEVKRDNLGKTRESRVEESKAQGKELDTKVEPENLGQMCDSGIEKSKAQGEKADTEVERGNLGKMGETGVKGSKAQGKELDTKKEPENLGRLGESGMEKSKTQGEKVDTEVESDNLGKVGETGVNESKAQGKKLDAKKEPENLDRLNESGIEKSKTQGEKVDTKVESDNLGKMGETRFKESKAQGKELDTKKVSENLGKLGESKIEKSKAQGEELDIEVKRDNLGKLGKTGVKESKAQGKELDTKEELENLGKLGESRIEKSKAQGEESNTELENLGKLGESRIEKSKAQGEESNTEVKRGNLGNMEETGVKESKAQGQELDTKEEPENLVKMSESGAGKSKAQEKKVDTEVESDNLGKMVETGVKESKAQENELDTKVEPENLDKMGESGIENSKAERKDVDTEVNHDNLCKTGETRVKEFKAQEKKLDVKVEHDDLGKLDQNKDLESNVAVCKNSRKMEVSEDSKSNYLAEKLGEKIEHVDPNVNGAIKRDGLGKVEKSGDSESKVQEEKFDGKIEQVDQKITKARELDSKRVEIDKSPEQVVGEDEKEGEPVFDGTEVPGMEVDKSVSTYSQDVDPQGEGSVWPDKAVALKNFVKEKGVVAVTSVFRRLSGSKEETEVDAILNENKVVSDSSKEGEAVEDSQKMVEKSAWNPLNFMKMTNDADTIDKTEHGETIITEPAEPIVTKGRIILYTRLGCQDCKEARLFLLHKRLRYVEINIDVYPTRKLELEKIAGTSAVPKVFFNEILVGGLSELMRLEESGKLGEKIDYLIIEAPSSEAPLPPLSGEDDVSCSSAVDELALVVRKMKGSIAVKDRFYRMRRFTNCFLGSEAVDFLSEDQYLEREEAVEFGRKLASKLFFQHVLDENLFEDGSHLYRFLDNDPVVSQCYNIPRGITEVKPKPISEIASRLRFLSYAMYEAYTSEDGRHIDYRSIHGSEEFARYLRIVQELQRVELHDIPREEKLAFFINLYNMMAIHATLVLGHPAGALERRKLFGDFKYVIGGCTYSLSAIQNGILRGNQRPPYNLMKPFGAKDKRSQVALPYPEPTIHFALVCGTRSGPALRCYSPGNIDKELMEAARNFLRGGGLIVDLQAKVASVSKILKWFSIDFGKNEVEVLKHASNYLEPTISEALLELLADAQLKVTYQPYDWELNC